MHLRVGVEGVFSGAYIHYDSPCPMSGFGVDGKVGVKAASTPFTYNLRPKPAGRCGRGHSGAYLHYDSPCPMSGFGVDGKVGVVTCVYPIYL